MYASTTFPNTATASSIGVPVNPQYVALGKLLLNEEAIAADLNNMWNVCAEAIQTILRREGYPKPYEALKALTRKNSVVDANSISEFIDTLNVSEEIKAELRKITPMNYTGM